MRYLAIVLLLISVLFDSGCVKKKASKLDADDYRDTVLFKKAVELTEQEKIDDAIDVYKQIITSNPDNLRACLNYATLLQDYRPTPENLIKSIFYYQKYLDERGFAEKTKLIKNRKEVAERLFSAMILSDKTGMTALLAELEKENRKLKLQLKNHRVTNKESYQKKTEVAVKQKKKDLRKTPKRKVKVYTVKPGDSLSIIAQKVYNNKDKWVDIYKANEKALRNSDNLLIGQVLVIP